LTVIFSTLKRIASVPSMVTVLACAANAAHAATASSTNVKLLFNMMISCDVRFTRFSTSGITQTSFLHMHRLPLSTYAATGRMHRHEYDDHAVGGHAQRRYGKRRNRGRDDRRCGKPGRAPSPELYRQGMLAVGAIRANVGDITQHDAAEYGQAERQAQ